MDDTQSTLSDQSNGVFELKSISEAYSSWGLFKSSPRELWIILFAKFLESFGFIAEDLVFLLYLKEEIGLTQTESGLIYSLTACLTFVYGLLFSGYLIDKAGVRISLIIGSLCLTLARLCVSCA
jgi:dipeptide/tripeptide permease